MYNVGEMKTLNLTPEQQQAALAIQYHLDVAKNALGDAYRTLKGSNMSTDEGRALLRRLQDQIGQVLATDLLQR